MYNMSRICNPLFDKTLGQVFPDYPKIPRLIHCLYMSTVHSIQHAGIVALWTYKRDAQLKWSFYVCVSCTENPWWCLSSFARVTFCDLTGHLKFF